MIPIVAISNLVTAAVSGIITVLIARSYKKQPDLLKKDFLRFFIFLTFYFGLLGSPSIFISDTYRIGIILSVASAIIASAFFIIFAKRVNNERVRLRSYLLGYGMLALILASVLAYVASPILSSILLYNVAAGIIALTGVILMGSGILTKIENGKIL